MDAVRFEQGDSSSPCCATTSLSPCAVPHGLPGAHAAQTRRVQPAHPSPGTSSIRRRVDALERELTVIRLLRVEVEQVRPGLLPDRGADGWRSTAAERYSERLDELRVGLAGGERLLVDVEGMLLRELEIAHLELIGASGGTAWTN